jgi:hypothetical protein
MEKDHFLTQVISKLFVPSIPQTMSHQFQLVKDDKVGMNIDFVFG